MGKKMGAPEGILPVLLISGLLLGTCLSKQACADDACFDQGIQELKIERSKTDSTSGLKYVERSTDLVATVDMIGVCLPGVNPNVLADTFLSCSNKKVEEVCTMVKRGWLEDKEGKSVVNENAVLATFKELDGGEDAVRECLQIPEVYEYEYYYYDYANYFDEYDYDYLEESSSGSRQRRAVSSKGVRGEQRKRNKGRGKGKGKKDAKKDKNRKNRKNSPRRKGGKGQTEKKNKKNSARKGGKENNKRPTKKALKKKERKEKKKAKKQARKAEKKAKKQARKAKKKAKKEAKKEARKAERKADKKVENTESAKAEKDARKKALSKLGLKKMPSKSTLEKLTCVQDKITQLLVTCAKNILSKTN